MGELVAMPRWGRCVLELSTSTMNAQESTRVLMAKQPVTLTWRRLIDSAAGAAILANTETEDGHGPSSKQAD